MPPKHGADHGHQSKPNGPKERELAVALTVAVLNASRLAEPVEAIEKVALGIYDRMLAAVTKRGAVTGDAGRE